MQRSNCLPGGGSLGANDLSALARELRRALDWAAATPEILFRRDAAARDLWQDRYLALSQLRPGLHGAATSRAIYAAMDATSVIALSHLQAALAVWDYCSASAALLFGMSTGDLIADRIREAIEASGALPKHQIRRLYHGHLESSRIAAALEKLVALGALHARTERTGGRPSTRWSPIEGYQPEAIEELPAEDDAPAEDQ